MDTFIIVAPYVIALLSLIISIITFIDSFDQ